MPVIALFKPLEFNKCIRTSSQEIQTLVLESCFEDVNMHHLNSYVRAWEIIPKDSDADRMPVGNYTGYWVWPHRFSCPPPTPHSALPILVESKCVANSQFSHLLCALYILIWRGVKCCLVIHSPCCWQAERGEWKLKGRVFVMLVPKANFRLITSIAESLWRTLKFLYEAQVWREVDWHSRVWPWSAVNAASILHQSSH